ncbi:MAG: FKBP-type peptidyl-prolyl cis-trans isomerase [Chitinivibrionia bacterium]|jgi:FKBP-type peptidyl-prolyl cis-trans isomerase|nr:FKBP-type peptidyl-prolyl cis-trans isomerase [Chitinivibrionia bacterium]
MKKVILSPILISALLAFAVVGCKVGGGKDGAVSVKKNFELTSEQDSFSYIIGRDISSSLQILLPEINKDILFSAIAEGLDTTTKSRIEDDATVSRIMQTVMMRISDNMRAKAESEVEAGVEFLAKNKERQEVSVTESGLQYEVLDAGDTQGAKPVDENIVEVRYTGTFVNGNVFDKTSDTETRKFPVNGVIAGWTEGLKLMNVGSKYKFYIPSNLAYGSSGRPGVAPNSTLIFEVELVGIE